MTGSPALDTHSLFEHDPATKVGEWVKVRGKFKEAALFLATDISTIGDTDRERLRLRGNIQAIDVAGKVLTIMGLALTLTETTEIEDLKGRSTTAERLRVSQPVVVWATRSDKDGSLTARKISVTGKASPKWQVEGIIRSRDDTDSRLAILEVGPLRVTLDRSTSVIDIKHRAARVVPFNPSTWQTGHRELIWSDPRKLDPDSGFGTAARQLILALERVGVDVTISPTSDRAAPGFERFYRPLDHWDKLGFYYHWRFHPSVFKCEHVINCSLWDTARLPEHRVDEINAVAALQYVPCQQNLESFRECGVRVPIKVLHYGVDSNRFPYLDRIPSEYFTFGTFGDLHPRKGIDVLIRAFQEEFHAGEPVRLLMKSTSPMDAYATEDPRITAISGRMDHDALLELLRQMDAFVLPSRGEGFGLCGLEAMSTGLPLIATNWSGPAEYLDAHDSFPLSYRLVEAGGTKVHSVKYFGLWAEPDYEHLRHLMRWVYEHRDRAAEMGRAAAARIHKDWTWDRVAQQVVDDLDDLVRG